MHLSRIERGLLGAGLAAAATAIGVEALALRTERRHPPRGGFLEAGGTSLHVTEQGDGQPPVVILHGNGMMVEDFASTEVPAMLAKHHRVLSFDRPGFGHSPRSRLRLWHADAQAAVLASAIRALGLHRPIVVAHSWATQVAVALALHHPASVGGLVLLGGYYFPTARADVVLFSPPAVPVLGDLLRYTIAPVLGWALAGPVLRQTFAPQPVPARFRREFPLGMALRPWQIRAVAEDSAAMVPWAALHRAQYPRLRLPIALLAGTEDRIADPQRQSRRFHHMVANSTLRLLPGLGHMLHHFAPEAVAEAVREVAAAAPLAAAEAAA